MSVMTIRPPDAQHERLRALARARGTSVDKVMEDLVTRALIEFDLEARFRARAARGDPAAAMALLDRPKAEDQKTVKAAYVP